jgi:hypothetical protein
LEYPAVGRRIILELLLWKWVSSSSGHRAWVKVRHLVLFAAKSLTSAQLFFSGFILFSSIRRHVVLRRPFLLVGNEFRIVKWDVLAHVTMFVFRTSLLSRLRFLFDCRIPSGNVSGLYFKLSHSFSFHIVCNLLFSNYL